MDADAGWVVTDDALNKALGAELRKAREAAGLTRPELVAALPFAVGVATLLNYEHGKRTISYRRLLEFARVLATSAPELLRRAIDSVESIKTILVELNLQAVIDDDDRRFGLLRTWAKNKLGGQSPASTVVRLHHSAVRELAVLVDVPLNDLVEYLERVASLKQVSAAAST